MKDLIKPKNNSNISYNPTEDNYNPVISSNSVLLRGKGLDFEEKYLLIEKYLSEFETEELKKAARDNIGVYSSGLIDLELEEIKELILLEVNSLRDNLGTREDGPSENGTAFGRISYLSLRIDNLIDNASEDYNTLKKIELIIKAEIERSTLKDNYFLEELNKFPDTVMSGLLDNTLSPNSVRINYGVNKRSTNLIYTESKEISSATQENAGVMSAQDKINLDVVIPNKIVEESNRALLRELELELNLNSHINNLDNPHNVTKELVGLGNLTNDALVKRSEMGTASGVATLNELGLVPSNLLPSYVDDIVDCYATYDKSDNGILSNINLYSDSEHLNPITGESGKIYIDITGTNSAYQFRWTGTLFSVVGAPTVIGEVTGTAFDGGRGKILEEKVEKLSNKEWTAETVKFTTNLTITADVGVHTIGSSGSKTLETAGKTVKQVMDLLFASEKNPTITLPYVNLTSSTMGAKEVGTSIIPVYTASLNPGTYQYGPATEVTATSWIITDTNGGSKTEASGNFEEFLVIDNTSYKITAVTQHTEGTIPLTNLGNEYAAGKIQAGSKTKLVGTITGYRNSFYGTLEDKEELTSATIRTLGKSNKALSNGSTFNITIPIGALRVVIAYPATLRNLTSVLDVNGLGAEIVTSFTEVRINVEGINGYLAIEYKVYYLDYANPNDTNNTYKVII